MADHLIPFTEAELKRLIEAIGCAISEYETRHNKRLEWKALLERLKTYEK